MSRRLDSDTTVKTFPTMFMPRYIFLSFSLISVTITLVRSQLDMEV